MIGLSAFTVFALGLRHGADPDHLAAIDNLTRNAYTRTPLLSRFVGTLFAGGHALMVLAISAIVGLLGVRFSAHAALVETIGTWISIVVLLAIAAANIANLRTADGAIRPVGVKTRLLPPVLRESTNVLIAIPVGLLFGFGFETSSQIATYAVAFGAEAGLWGAVIVGSMFSAGMIVTDTLDSVLVHRLVSFDGAQAPRVMRTWTLAVTALAVLVAAYEIALISGWHSPASDLQVSAGLVGALTIVFAYTFASTRRTPTPSSLATIPKGDQR